MKTKIIRLEEIDSTNRYLKNYREEGDEEMIVAVADYQAAGKGQGTHTWESEKGKNLLFSIKVYPHWIPVRRQFVLSMAGALAVKDALDSYVENITLKWPNDVYWNDQKISGTLIENTIDSKGIKSCVFGIGLNVNQLVFHSDAPNPIALQQIIGRSVDRALLLQNIVEAFSQRYQLLLQGNFQVLHTEYMEHLYRRTGIHPYEDGDGPFQASIVDISPLGMLTLRKTDGSERTYAFKEVKAVIV